jgi:hypothetical protein
MVDEMESQKKFEDLFLRFDDPSEAWDCKEARKLLAEANSGWLWSLRPWSIFITLTFKEEKPSDIAKALFKRLVRTLNQDVFGKHYSKKVGHSYFSYVLAIEYQRRDVIHFHVLIDRPVNFERIHILWNSWAGFVWTEIVKDQIDVVNYVCKYISKGGEIYPFLAKKEFIPAVLPYWWKTPNYEIKGNKDESIIL